jgi:lipopolysaccharide/colanic/teichoic acid biosynthesis glycosyltransferase
MADNFSSWLDMERLSSRVSSQQIALAKAYDKHWSKRLMDLVITIPALFVLSPLLVSVAIAIRIDSPGPVIFQQERVGRYGKIFKMYKFRSMKNDIDDSLHVEHITAYAKGELDLSKGNKIEADPRITRVGNVIRKASIDELPQLFNVLKGEMSIIGPRPVPIYEVNQYNLWQSERLEAVPGITGLWQVVRRGKSSFKEQLRLDIRYIRNQSFWLNLKILLLTIPAVISKAGAE